MLMLLLGTLSLLQKQRDIIINGVLSDTSRPSLTNNLLLCQISDHALLLAMKGF